MSETRKYHVVDDFTGEIINTVNVADGDIEPFNETANALGFYLAEEGDDDE